jgi:hypothetical protein
MGDDVDSGIARSQLPFMGRGDHDLVEAPHLGRNLASPVISKTEDWVAALDRVLDAGRAGCVMPV